MSYDNSTAKTVYGSSDTMSYTVGSGSGRYLVVFIYLQTDTDKVTAVSYAGTAMTRLLRVNAGGGSSVFAYGLASPTTGANNVSITLTDASLLSYSAISADSITAATPVVAGTCSAFMSSPSSQSATATGAGIAFGYHATGADTANQFTVSGSTRGVQNLNSNLQATAYQAVSGAGSVSMTETWTGGNSKNGVKMVVLLEATGGPATLAPADGAHAHAADNLTLSASGATNLVIADGAHAHAGDNVVLAVGNALVLPALKNNAGTVLASETGATAYVYDVSTGALVVKKTGQTTNGSGVMTVVDASIVSGTTYRVVIVLASGAEGMDKVAA